MSTLRHSQFFYTPREQDGETVPSVHSYGFHYYILTIMNAMGLIRV